jgi:hypothetical protein
MLYKIDKNLENVCGNMCFEANLEDSGRNKLIKTFYVIGQKKIFFKPSKCIVYKYRLLIV